MGQWLHMIYSKLKKSLLYRHQETHQYRRGQGRCSHQHTEIAELLLLPSCCHGRIPSTRKKVPSSILCVSAWEAEHALLPHCSWSMEAMHLLPSYSGKAHTSLKITLVSLQSTGSHLAAAMWYFCYQQLQRQTSRELERGTDFQWVPPLVPQSILPKRFLK